MGFRVVVSRVVGFLAVNLRVAVPSAKQITRASWLAKRPARKSLVVADRIDRPRAVQGELLGIAVRLGIALLLGMRVQRIYPEALSFAAAVNARLAENCGCVARRMFWGESLAKGERLGLGLRLGIYPLGLTEKSMPLGCESGRLMFAESVVVVVFVAARCLVGGIAETIGISV